VRPGRDADPSPPSSAEVKNRVELPLLSVRAFVAYERVKPTYSTLDITVQILLQFCHTAFRHIPCQNRDTNYTVNETSLLTLHISPCPHITSNPTSRIAFLAFCGRQDFTSALATRDNQSATISFYIIKTISGFWLRNCTLFELNFQTDNRQNYR